MFHLNWNKSEFQPQDAVNLKINTELQTKAIKITSQQDEANQVQTNCDSNIKFNNASIKKCYTKSRTPHTALTERSETVDLTNSLVDKENSDTKQLNPKCHGIEIEFKMLSD